MKLFTETLYDALGQSFRIDKVYFESKTEHQHLMIFHNAALGRVMVLDGIVQTTEKDEFIYHEMMAHVPLLAHGKARRVLIIGGGDGAMLREVLKHKTVEQVTMVEIDQAVIDMAREYLPNHSQGAFDDARANIVIADGMDFVRDTDLTFDVIISDSTDPIGPGEILFTDDFYGQCKRILNNDGIIATQNGVAFFQLDGSETRGKRHRDLEGAIQPCLTTLVHEFIDLATLDSGNLCRQGGRGSMIDHGSCDRRDQHDQQDSSATHRRGLAGRNRIDFRLF